jgi:hypothetical protein
MTSFASVFDMSGFIREREVRIDAVLICHVINNVVAADNVTAADNVITYFAFIALKMLLRQLRNCVRLTTSSMRHRAAVRRRRTCHPS